MSNYYDRYRRGERVEVWSDLIALGEAVRQEPVYSDAVAVARETMTRARENVETLITRLDGIGYEFLTRQRAMQGLAAHLEGMQAFAAKQLHNPDHQSDHLCGSIDRLYNHRSSGGRSSSKFVSARAASLGGRFPGGEELLALPTPARLADIASTRFLHWCACGY